MAAPQGFVRHWSGARPALTALALTGLTLAGVTLAVPAAAEIVAVDGLGKPALLRRDGNGIVDVVAADERGMVFAQGYAHARDRFFQMDVLRRTAGGTLAELLGAEVTPAPGARRDVLAEDVEFRTIGLRRAAQRTLDALDAPMRGLLDAYGAGVNAWLAMAPALPEYQHLNVTPQPWTPLDTLAVAKLVAFQLSVDLDDIDRSDALARYLAAFPAAEAARARALFTVDTWRVQPFTAVATVPAANAPAAAAASPPPTRAAAVADTDATLLPVIAVWRERLAAAPNLARMLTGRADGTGSNAFAIAGKLASGGRALLANDPHLSLSVPSVFYPIRLSAVADGINVEGASFAGVPYAAQGLNRHFAWGVTASGVDVTDVYAEVVRPCAAAASGLCTEYRGTPEPVEAIPQVFRANVGGALVTVPVPAERGGVTFIVPRRNHGPIIALAGGRALSLQWTGFGPTFEITAFRGLCRATSAAAFDEALQRFDVGSQNVLYADRGGRIGYALTGEIPLREDLQQGRVATPPYLIRDGRGGQEWQPLAGPPPAGQAIPYGVLPSAEMPRATDPDSGYLLNANNDPLGDTFDNDPFNQLRPEGGIRYLGADFNLGLRAGRIEALIQARRDRPGLGLTLADLAAIQADVVVPDAEVFVPQIAAAFAAAAGAHPQLAALAADAGIAEAVARLQAWRFTAPTGEPAGFDAADVDGVPLPLPAGEAEESIAATLFSFWRAAMIANTIDWRLGSLPKPSSRYAIRALRHLLDTFPENAGIGASGLDFLANPAALGTAVGADPATRRDVIILRSLGDALDRLASPDLAPAFAGSRDQDDYRWGRLHRLTVEHPLGGAFSLTAAAPFEPPFAGLPGIPVDGAFETVDRASHNVRGGLAGRGDPVNDFVFAEGPIDRFVARPSGPGLGNRSRNALPGGVSGVAGEPLYANLFGPWLTNDGFTGGGAGVCQGACREPLLLRPPVPRW